MLETFTAVVTVMPTTDPETRHSLILTHPMWGQRRRMYRAEAIIDIILDAPAHIGDEVEELLNTKGYTIDARHGDRLVYTDGVTYVFTYDVEVIRDTPRTSDCPWYGRPESTNPWWARVQCRNGIIASSGLCDAHHHAQPGLQRD